jgi:hypothetical protein
MPTPNQSGNVPGGKARGKDRDERMQERNFLLREKYDRP